MTRFKKKLNKNNFFDPNSQEDANDVCMGPIEHESVGKVEYFNTEEIFRNLPTEVKNKLNIASIRKGELLNTCELVFKDLNGQSVQFQIRDQHTILIEFDRNIDKLNEKELDQYYERIISVACEAIKNSRGKLSNGARILFPSLKNPELFIIKLFEIGAYKQVEWNQNIYHFKAGKLICTPIQTAREGQKISYEAPTTLRV